MSLQRLHRFGKTWLLVLGLIACGAILYAQSENLLGEVSTTDEEKKPLPLGACTGREEEDLYKIDRQSLQFPGKPDVIDIWSERYHAQVVKVVEEYMANSKKELDCMSTDVERLLPAGEEMLLLASKLPPWQVGEDGDGTEDAEEKKEELEQLKEELGRIDTPAVLLEYLRTYECALMERSFFLFGDVTKETKEIFDKKPLSWPEVIQEFVDQWGKIQSELAIARPTLNRVLTVTSGKERLQTIDNEAECFYRATLDLRNAIALGAESAACFPRVQDAKDPLRDRK